MQTIEENCKNTNRNAKADEVYEIDCETNSRAPIQFTKSKQFKLSQFATDVDHIVKVQSMSLEVTQLNQSPNSLRSQNRFWNKKCKLDVVSFCGNQSSKIKMIKDFTKEEDHNIATWGRARGNQF